ncbi:MAG: dTDP-4-dehydrorhamnose reductase [Candidatus Altiarchaeota archaeon]
MKRVLVTGSTGLLGVRLMESFSGYDLKGLCRRPFNDSSLAVDLTGKDSLIKAIGDFNPDTLIHSAAVTNVDYCEEHKEEAWNINVEGTRNVVDACKETGCKIVFISTDYVFDGEGTMYDEEDEVNPVNHYGLTKLEGEKIVQESGLDFMIARTSVLYGWHEPRLNYATWVLDKLGQGEEINVVDDRYKSPTLTDNLAEVVKGLCEKKASGIYHTSGSERISMYDFAVKTAEAFGLDPKLIRRQKSGEFRQKALRPPDSSLNVSKVKKMGLRLFNVSEGLEYMGEHRK